MLAQHGPKVFANALGGHFYMLLQLPFHPCSFHRLKFGHRFVNPGNCSTGITCLTRACCTVSTCRDTFPRTMCRKYDSIPKTRANARSFTSQNNNNKKQNNIKQKSNKNFTWVNAIKATAERCYRLQFTWDTDKCFKAVYPIGYPLIFFFSKLS